MSVSTSTARTTAVQPESQELRSVLKLSLVFALVKFVLHVATNLWQQHIGYGYFRDEFYYLICGRHLAWGYVDHGPIVALQARIAETIFGHAITGIRILSAAAGASRVFLTGMLVWALGGRRAAQSLAMTAILLAPQYLGLDSYLSMNSFESLFWMTCLLSLILIMKGRDERFWWVIFGLSAGVGLLNKPSMTFFLVSVLVGLLLTEKRRVLFTRSAAIGILALIVIALPNLVWQIHNHWPTLEFLNNGRTHNKNMVLGPMAFTGKQILNLQPLTLLLWVPGLIWLLRRRDWRWAGYTFIIFFVAMMLLHAKDYYVVPIYPILFAAGGVSWEQRFSSRRTVLQNRVFAFPIYQTMLLVFGIILLPMAIPVLPPMPWITYAKAIHLYNLSGNTETDSSGALPQFYADRFGWQEEVDQVSRIYHSLPHEDQQKVGILASNYGEASALNFLGEGLPYAISGHNNYWVWGPHGYSGDIMIVINGVTPDEMNKFYDSVVIAGRMDHPLSMPFEHRNIYLVRGRKKNLIEDWNSLKFYF